MAGTVRHIRTIQKCSNSQ